MRVCSVLSCPFWLKAVGSNNKSTNPYCALDPTRSLILQGCNKNGKTTHLRTPAVLVYCRLFNGGAGKGVNTFKEWQTIQLFGNFNMEGAETYCYQWMLDLQRLRLLLHALGLPIAQLCYIILDQYEKLFKRFPEETLDWANFLTNKQVRDGAARMISFVNSHARAQTFLNLKRFSNLILEPPYGKGAGVNLELFGICGRRIGLYKLVQIERGAVEKGMEETFFQKQIARWEKDFRVPYPYKDDSSCRHG